MLNTKHALQQDGTKHVQLLLSGFNQLEKAGRRNKSTH